MFKDKMKTTPIPERVYSLVCALIKRPLSKDELREALEPKVCQTGNTKYFADVYEAALELELISEKENEVSLRIEKKHLANLQTFRKYVMPIIFNMKSSMFYKVTKAYVNANEKVFEFNMISAMGSFIQERLDEPMNILKEHMLGWRFWVSFLGVGILHNDNMLIPTMYKQLVDVLDLVDYQPNKEYTANEFLALIEPYCHFAFDLNSSNKELSLALSNGIRMLHDMGYIEIKDELDATGVWHFYKVDGLQNKFSHIKIREAK